MKRILLFLDKAKKSISLINTGVLLAIITPIAYLLGSSFHQGYLSAFGLEINNFQSSVQDIYINSYFVLGKIFLDTGDYIATIFKLPKITTLIVIILSFSLFLYLIFFLKKKLSVKNIEIYPHLKQIEEILIYLNYKQNDFTKSILITLTSFEIISGILILILLIPLSWWTIPLIGDSIGRKIAILRINEFNMNGCVKDKKKNINICFVVRDEKGNEIHEGLLIATNEKDIAMFKKEGLFLFSKKDNLVLQRKTN